MLERRATDVREPLFGAVRPLLAARVVRREARADRVRHLGRAPAQRQREQQQERVERLGARPAATTTLVDGTSFELRTEGRVVSN